MELKPTFISYIQSNAFSPVLPESANTPSVLGHRTVSPVATERADSSLGKRFEPSRPKPLLKQFGCWLVRPFNAMAKGLDGVFTKASQAPRPSSAATSAAGKSPVYLTADQLIADNKPIVIAAGLAGAGEAEKLRVVTADDLLCRHSSLAEKNGAMRRVSTGLTALVNACPPEFKAWAQALLGLYIEGLPYSQWATTGDKASELIGAAKLRDKSGPGAVDPAMKLLGRAAEGIRELGVDVLDLVAAVREASGADCSFSTLFGVLGRSPRIEHKSSTIKLDHWQVALVLQAMVKEVISVNKVREQITTGAELELLRSLYGARELKPQSLEAVLPELATGTGDQRAALGNLSIALMQFVRTVEQREHQENSATQPYAPSPVRRETTAQMRSYLQRLEPRAAQHLLGQLQGPLGKGVLAIFRTLAEEAKALDKQPGQPLSRSYLRAGGQVNTMITLLQKRLLGTSAVPVLRAADDIVSLPILAPQERVAMARVMLEDPRLVSRLPSNWH